MVTRKESFGAQLQRVLDKDKAKKAKNAAYYREAVERAKARGIDASKGLPLTALIPKREGSE
jgi:hypothetical protein